MSIEPQQLLRSARRWWWLLIVAPLLGAAAGYAVASLQTPRFVAAATVLVTPTREPGILAFDDLQAGARLAVTYARLATSPPVLDAAADTLSPAVEGGDLREIVSARTTEELPIIEISASNSDPERAAAIANAVAEEVVARIRADGAALAAPAREAAERQIADVRETLAEIEERIRSLEAEPDQFDPAVRAEVDQLGQEAARLRTLLTSLETTTADLDQRAAADATGASVWGAASPPDEPVAPRRSVLVVLGALAGLMVGAGGIVAAALLDRSRARAGAGGVAGDRMLPDPVSRS